MRARCIPIWVFAVFTLAWASSADATPMVGISLSESGYSSWTTTSSTGWASYVGSYGTYSFNATIGTGQPALAPFSIDLSSVNASSKKTGSPLTMMVTETGLTSLNPELTFHTILSGQMISGTLKSISEQTYIDTSDTAYGKGTPLGSLTSLNSFSSTPGSVGSGLFSETLVLTVSEAPNSAISIDGSLSVPEPESLLLLGTGLFALGMVGWLRRRS